MRVFPTFFVYMQVSSSRRALYTGVTNSLYNRHDQHKASDASTFVGRYHATRLVYYEAFRYIGNAIAREKEIKGWTRNKKEALVQSMNPQWRDLSVNFGKQFRPTTKTQG